MTVSARIRTETGLPAVNDRRPRRGIIVLELILCLAILLVFALAVVQFGLLLANYEHVEFSSRVGAKVATELSTTELGSSPSADAVKDAVDRILATRGRSSCQVFVAHNAPCNGLSPQTHVSTATCPGCEAQTTPPLPSIADVESGTVRVTVCIRAEELAPDLLSWLGFSINGRIVRVSTTYPYEGCPAGPVVIPILNESFENPAVAFDGAAPITNWTTVNGTAEVFRPDPMDGHFAAVPHGVQVGRLTPATPGSATIRQVLPTTVVNGADYRLSVSVGDSNLNSPPTSFTIRLRAGVGGPILASDTTGAIPSGDFVQLVATGSGTGPTAGQNLVVEIEANNAGITPVVGYVDQVRLLREN